MYELKYGLISSQKATFLADEPLFLLRAKDKLAPQAVRSYAEKCAFIGTITKNPVLVEVSKRAKMVALEMDEWQRQNEDKVKLPD